MASPIIRFTDHALTKFSVFQAHGLIIERTAVERVIADPHRIEEGNQGRLIAQGPLDENHILRVVYEQQSGERVVVTFYPGKRARYEQDTI